MTQRPDYWYLRTHGHCADVLMADYGIPSKYRVSVCEQIDKIYRQISLIHAVIIAGVRGWANISQTEALKAYLDKHKTHEPLNRKPAKTDKLPV